MPKRNKDSGELNKSIKRFSKKLRRGSFLLYWNDALMIPAKLQKLKKCRLELSQREFELLENQLYVSNIINSKEGSTFICKHTTVNFDNIVYIKLIRFIPLDGLLRLLIWVYFNKYMETPTIELDLMFANKGEDPKQVLNSSDDIIKSTVFKVNNTYTLYHAQWTIPQRVVARKTRDYCINNFKITKNDTMLWDLEWTPSHKQFIKEFLQALLKANVDLKIIADICCKCLNTNLKMFTGEKYLEKETVTEKEIIFTTIQRSSITEFTPLEKDIQATITLQRWYKKRYQKMKNAVLIIERWYLPHYRKTLAIKIRMIEGASETIHAQLDSDDLFKFKEFKDEIKKDYRSLFNSNIENQGWKYWLAVIVIFIVPVVGTYYLFPFIPYESYIFIWVFWFVAQFGSVWRLHNKSLWNQTIILIILTCLLIQTNIPIEYPRLTVLRFCFNTLIVAVGRKKWLYGFVILSILRAIHLVINMKIFPYTHYFVFMLYDLYVCITMKGASRQGKPIEMIHKVMVNVIFLLIIVVGLGYSVLATCYNF